MQRVISPLAAVVVFSAVNSTFADFLRDKIFLSSSLTDEVRIYDAETLAFESAFTHPLFQIIGAPAYAFGPNGVAFNERGNLLVAAHTHFVEFSSPGVEFARYPKVTIEATETIIVDSLGNLYTTTATGGSNQLNQYRASDYIFQQTIPLPAGAGSLTGITFDSDRRLYIASQSGARIHVLQADANFSVFTFSHSITSANIGGLEGLQFNQNGELIAAGGNITRYNPSTGLVLGSFDAPNDQFPVPLTVDNSGRIYVADFENGIGTASADIFRFAPDGSSFITVNDPNLFGPFGLAISGTNLPGGPVTLDVFLVIDEDSIDNGNPPNFFSDVHVNDDIADIGVRTQLPFFAANVGAMIALHTGEVGDEGWFALKTIPDSWADAGPTDDGLCNFLFAGPGLGTADMNGDREALLDKIPLVTPLRASGLALLEGQQVCAVVFDSDVSLNYDPLDGSLKGANLGVVAFSVVSVTAGTDGSSSSLPEVVIEILDADEFCDCETLTLLLDAPEPISSSEPFDIEP